MKIYSYKKLGDLKMTNLGAKIALDKLNSQLNIGNHILLRVVHRSQSDFRIRKVILHTGSFGKTKVHYVLAIESGKANFHEENPRPRTEQESHKFSTVNQAIDFLERVWNIKKQDWIITPALKAE